jgi:RNA polymerase sigma factor (sigma-70 family)
MPESDDITRLKQYVAGDESAFAALVERYVHLVYSTALRQTGNPSQAEEITQAVFIILAQKAKSLGPRTILSGWLYQTARLAAANFLRSEIRRQKREQEAYMESLLNEPTPNLWQQIAPLLDDAMGHLSEKDRNVVVLRFFQNQSAAEIGDALGIDSATAQKRITRAVGRLRKFFAKRSVTHSVELITGAISTNSVQAAPVALAKSVTAVALAKGAAAAVSTLTLVKGTMKMMIWMKLKLAIGIGAVVLLVGGTTLVALSGDSTNQNATASAPDEVMLVVPGESVGKVQKGMTTNEVEAVLGKPERWQGKIMIYDKRLGMSVIQGKSGVMVVFCGDSMLKYPGVKAFKGRTKEGIGMESSREAVIKAFGQPTTAKPWNLGQEELEYKNLGLTFTLEAGKVINIIVDFRKPQ